MYDEAQDFGHHRQEVDDAFSTLMSLDFDLASAKSILDVGGGQGMHCGFLQAHSATVICTDIIDYTSLYGGEFVKLVLEKHGRNTLPFDPTRCAFIKSDAMNLLFRTSLFDLCVSFNAFEHIPDPQSAFVEICRVLRPGGMAYVSLDPIWTCDTGSHFSSFVPDPWAHLVLDPAEFKRQMIAAGASAGALDDFPGAMNQRRLADYERAVSHLLSRYPVSLVKHDRYSGLNDPSARSHPNYRRALEAGYSEEELNLRRLRWVLRRDATGEWPNL